MSSENNSIYNEKYNKAEINLQNNGIIEENNSEMLNNSFLNQGNNFNQDDLALESDSIKNSRNLYTTISNAILRAGGITSKTDLSNIKLIREIPIGKGGGNEIKSIDLSSFINESDPTQDIRLFDGDRLYFSALKKPNADQIPKSVLRGISPRFITVDVYGRVDNPGTILLPLESSLSDALDLTGPIRPLSGKVNLIRYRRNGSMEKKTILFSASAKRGSKNNPILKKGDQISVKNSRLAIFTGVIKEVTSPFIGIYSISEIIKSLN